MTVTDDLSVRVHPDLIVGHPRHGKERRPVICSCVATWKAYHLRAEPHDGLWLVNYRGIPIKEET